MHEPNDPLKIIIGDACGCLNIFYSTPWVMFLNQTQKIIYIEVYKKKEKYINQTDRSRKYGILCNYVKSVFP